jgi:hypothetical protein
MPSRSSTTRRQSKNAANNPKELFQHNQARFDEMKMRRENQMPNKFRAVVLSSPIDENNVGTSKPGPNAEITPTGHIIVSVKPITDGEFLKIVDGDVSSDFSQVDTPVPSDGMPSFNMLKEHETNKFLKLVHRYHKIDDLKATSAEAIANTVSLKFGQIVNCYYRKGGPNNPLSPRDELVFKIPAGEIIHPLYTSFLEQVETNSAKEPFANNSNLAVSVLGAIPSTPSSARPTTTSTPVVSGPGSTKELTYKTSDGTERFLFVGDSQTFYPGVSFADLVLKDNAGTKSAQNGAPLSKIKQFLETELSKNSYSVITIMGGGNNSHSSNPPYNLYDEMYDLAKKTGAIVVAITNPTKANLPDTKRSKYPSNENLAKYVRNNAKPDIIIDANTLFSDISNFNPDKIHLNKNAHIKLKNEWIKKVSVRLKKKS